MRVRNPCADTPALSGFCVIPEGTRFALSFSIMAKERTRQNADLPPDEQAAPQTAGDTTAAVPDRDRVAMRAYELYQARGGTEGQELDDWLTAEREFQGPKDDRRGD